MLIPHGVPPPMFTTVSPGYDDFMPPSVIEWEKTVHIQPRQATSHHHNRNQVLYLINTTPNLQFSHSCLQDN